jgi:hypothetical protein
MKQLVQEGFASNHVDLGPFAERDRPARPRLLAELRDEQAQCNAHLHGQSHHAEGHVADGNAIAQRALLAEVLDHVAPLQLGRTCSIA